MLRLIIVAMCAASFGLLVTSSEAFSQEDVSKRKRTGETTYTAANEPSSAYNWNGFYSGGIGGADFLSALGRGAPFFEGEFYPGFPNPATPGIIAAYRSHHADKPALSIGVQAGYNFWWAACSSASRRMLAI